MTYFRLIKTLEGLADMTQPRLGDRDVRKLFCTLKVLRDHGVLTQFDVTRCHVRLSVDPGMQYLSREMGGCRWVVRTPFKVVVSLRLAEES